MMSGLLSHWSLILSRRDELADELARGEGLLAHWAGLAAVMAAGAAVYGLVLGMWHGTALTLYVAVKLPLVLLATSAITMLLSYVVAALLGLGLRFAQVANLTFLALATASLLLASLAPVALLFTVSLPEPEPSTTARLAHNLLYLLHTGFVGACGLAGCAVLWRGLQRMRPGARHLRAVFAAWVLAFALVGGEVAWALRPFVGSVYYPVAFLRPDALDGNVYEFVVREIVPYLLSRR
jgi:hypothetical protein